MYPIFPFEASDFPSSEAPSASLAAFVSFFAVVSVPDLEASAGDAPQPARLRKITDATVAAIAFFNPFSYRFSFYSVNL